MRLALTEYWNEDGGFGDYYHYFGKLVPGLQLNWTVLETKTFIEAFKARTSD